MSSADRSGYLALFHKDHGTERVLHAIDYEH